MCIFSDRIWFPVFEFMLFALSSFSFLRVTILREVSPISGVFHGEKSREFLSAISGAILTLVISVVFSLTTYPKDGLVFLYIVNIICVLYLSLYNGWSTNKLKGFLIRFENHNSNPHGN